VTGVALPVYRGNGQKKSRGSVGTTTNRPVFSGVYVHHPLNKLGTKDVTAEL